MEGLYTTHDAARILQVHPFTVAKWIDRGMLKAWKTAGGHRRVQAADLRAFLIQHALPVPEELQNGPAALGKFRLLIVDAEPASLRAIKRAFGQLESEVVLTVTPSGIEGLLLAGEAKPDAMLIDLDLDDLDPLEIFRQARRHESLAAVTLVAMTSRHTTAVVAQAIKAGAFACLAKPFDAASVLKRLCRRSAPETTVSATGSSFDPHFEMSAEPPSSGGYWQRGKGSWCKSGVDAVDEFNDNAILSSAGGTGPSVSSSTRLAGLALLRSYRGHSTDLGFADFQRSAFRNATCRRSPSCSSAAAFRMISTASSFRPC